MSTVLLSVKLFLACCYLSHALLALISRFVPWDSPLKPWVERYYYEDRPEVLD